MLHDSQVTKNVANRHSNTLQPCVQWGVNKHFYVHNRILNCYLPSLEIFWAAALEDLYSGITPPQRMLSCGRCIAAHHLSGRQPSGALWEQPGLVLETLAVAVWQNDWEPRGEAMPSCCSLLRNPLQEPRGPKGGDGVSSQMWLQAVSCSCWGRPLWSAPVREGWANALQSFFSHLFLMCSH